MARRPVDLAPARVALPDAGLGRGWESAALMGLTILLLGFGLVTLYSTSAFLAQQTQRPDHFFVVRQAAGAAVGLVAMVVCARIPYRVWERLAWPLMGVSVVLVVLVVLPWTTGIAPEIKGARRWLDLGVSFQPSDPAKLAMVVWTAMLVVKKHDQLHSLTRGLLPFLLVWAVLLVPIALEPDLSTACLLGLVGAMVVFAGGGRPGHFVFLGILMLPLIWAQFQVDFRAQRLLAFLDPASAAAGAGYQVRQSMIAVGSGGLFGVGFGEGRQKFGFVPEPHNDFIFAMIGEEWGFLGVSLVVLAYLALILLGFRIARRAPDRFGRLVALGVTNLVAVHAVLHMAVGLGLVPATGLALPLVSYGRSNLMVTLMSLGILMSVARETDRDWRPEHGEGRRRHGPVAASTAWATAGGTASRGRGRG
jgi:cell division protein FtsW